MFRTDSKSMIIKKKKNVKLDFTKMKTSALWKTLFKGWKEQTVEWEKIVANYISDEGLMSRKYTELSKPNSEENKKSN